MANPLDTDAGTELFSSYEAEFGVVKADLTQKLDQIPDLSGEPRKAALAQAERALEEADELVSSTATVKAILNLAYCAMDIIRGMQFLELISMARANLN